MNNRNSNILLFVIGVFSMTQIHVVGQIGISELFVFLAAPFVFLADYEKLRQDGFLTLVFLALAACIGCVVSSWANNISLYNELRGLASPYSVFAISVVLHRLLGKNLGGLKWLLVGIAISMIVNTFCFQYGAEAEKYSDGLRGFGAAEDIVSSPIYWTTRLNSWMMLPIQGWYLQLPTPIAFFVLSSYALICMMISASGRSAALSVLLSLTIILIARRSRKGIAAIGRHAYVFLAIMGIVIVVFKGVYQYAAENDMLGEDARSKYEHQTRSGNSLLRLIMGGRSEFFVGLTAALDKPIVGHGPWALDYDGYYERFLEKYGEVSDYEAYVRLKLHAYKTGRHLTSLIPTHSNIVGFWVSFGITGLILWVYVLWLYWDFFRHRSLAIPQWFGYLAIAIPSSVWHIFFSPFGARIPTVLILVCVLLARAVDRGAVVLPCDMLRQKRRFNER